MLRTDQITFNRNAEGELLSQEVTLLLEDSPTIKVRPLTRGQLQDIDSRDSEEEKVIELFTLGLVEPKLTKEQIKDLIPKYADAISVAIMAVSTGKTSEEMHSHAVETLSKQELKKK